MVVVEESVGNVKCEEEEVSRGGVNLASQRRRKALAPNPAVHVVGDSSCFMHARCSGNKVV